MAKMILFCFILVSISIHEVTSRDSQYLDATIMNFELVTNNEIAEANTSIDRKFVNGKWTTFASADGLIHEQVPCDAVIEYSYNIEVEEKFSDTPFYQNKKNVGDFIFNFENTSLGQTMRNTRKCITPEGTCPVKVGLYLARDCLVLSKLNSIFLAKSWKYTMKLFMPDGRPIAHGWMTVVVDDTDVLRARRPTAAQRARKERQKNGRHPLNNSFV